tara:strand:+ start:240 stop:821 length:582 start_codon:yes stop_codon:yes gene_type:complete
MEEALELYKKYGNNGYIGEKVTQLEHATQCSLLAEEYCKENNVDDRTRNDLVLGCLFHDIGHLIFYDNPELETMEEYGVMHHELVGSKYLSNLGFNKNICEFVENHIITKRYLITVNPSYYEQLSDASKKTFKYQGGKLTEKELNDFKSSELFMYHLKVRDFDDKAKSTEKTLLDKIKNMNHLDYYSKFMLPS